MTKKERGFELRRGKKEKKKASEEVGLRFQLLLGGGCPFASGCRHLNLPCSPENEASTREELKMNPLREDYMGRWKRRDKVSAWLDESSVRSRSG